jgi:hypothetical protein
MAKLSDYFSRSMIGEFSDDFWDNPVYESADKGSACFGREGCRQAYKYILDNGDDADPAVAKEIAATYCAYHADQCDKEAKEVARGKVIGDFVNTAFMAYLGVAYGEGKGKTSGLCNSFDADTRVLMADGTTRPIAEVRTGDKVVATDPATGERAVRTVTAELVHQDDDLVDLRVQGGDGTTSTVRTTATHLFWDDTAHRWTPAVQLTPGHTLRTADRGHVTLVGLLPRAGAATMYNLTIEQLHTYFVLAGHAPVLVHNDGGAPPGVWTINPERSTKIMNGGPFKANYYQQPPDAKKTVYWWSPDRTGHGDSKWKVFRETSKGLEWVADAGEDGTFIEGKHKGNTGKFISWKSLKTVRGC